jgi:hypothetical protein
MCLSFVGHIHHENLKLCPAVWGAVVAFGAGVLVGAAAGAVVAVGAAAAGAGVFVGAAAAGAGAVVFVGAAGAGAAGA